MNVMVRIKSIIGQRWETQSTTLNSRSTLCPSIALSKSRTGGSQVKVMSQRKYRKITCCSSPGARSLAGLLLPRKNTFTQLTFVSRFTHTPPCSYSSTLSATVQNSRKSIPPSAIERFFQGLKRYDWVRFIRYKREEKRKNGLKFRV